MLRGTHAEVDPKALGIGLEALFMIELSKHQRGTVDQFMDDIAGVPEVRVAFLVTGRYDVVVHVVVRIYAAFEGPRPRPVRRAGPGSPASRPRSSTRARHRYQLPVFQMED